MMGFNLNEWEVVVHQSLTSFETEVHFRRPGPGGMEFLWPDFSIHAHKPGDRLPEPTLRLPEGVMASLFQKLWDNGMRPKDRRYEAEADLLRGQLDIQRQHLEDMRTLVFKPKD